MEIPEIPLIQEIHINLHLPLLLGGGHTQYRLANDCTCIFKGMLDRDMQNQILAMREHSRTHGKTSMK